MVKAFRYGAPPHGGCAAGIDRIVMLLADDQHPRGHHVPDEPARRGPADGRAIRAHERTVARRDQATGQAGGIASYLRIAPEAGSIEVGHICIAPVMQQGAAMTEAMFLMMDWAFRAGYRRYEWKCNALNLPSRRAAQRLGFSFEGVFRNHMVIKGRNRDSAWFSVISDEWPALAEAYRVWLAPSNFDARGRQRERLSDLTRLVRANDDPRWTGQAEGSHQNLGMAFARRDC
jgi:RimJ/RimL family protein N-acetyltransferase